jgi:predicted DNA-binding protein
MKMTTQTATEMLNRHITHAEWLGILASRYKGKTSSKYEREITTDEWNTIFDARMRMNDEREARLAKVAEEFGRDSDTYYKAKWPGEPWIQPEEYSLTDPQGNTNLMTVVHTIEAILTPAVDKAIRKPKGDKRKVWVRWLDYDTFFVFVSHQDPGDTEDAGWTYGRIPHTDPHYSELLPKYELHISSIKWAKQAVEMGIQRCLQVLKRS